VQWNRRALALTAITIGLLSASCHARAQRVSTGRNTTTTQVVASVPTSIAPTLPAPPTTVLPKAPIPPVGPPPTVATRPPPSLRGSILFISRTAPPPKPTTGPVTPSSNGYDIWVMRADGSDRRPLTHTGHDAEPSLSPDGRHIAWVVGNNTVWTMASDGSSPRKLATCPLACMSPRWSPDGSRLVYTTTDGRKGDVVVMRADGTQPHAYGVSINAYDASWAPDGHSVLVSVSTMPAGIWRLDVASGVLHRIHDGTSISPMWSPDGRQIMFGNGSQLFTMAPDGSAVRQLTSGGGQFLRGMWSPDMRTILYDYFGGAAGPISQVWSMAADTTGKRPLTAGMGESYEATY